MVGRPTAEQRRSGARRLRRINVTSSIALGMVLKLGESLSLMRAEEPALRCLRPARMVRLTILG